MGVGILAKRVVLELGSSTNFVYSLKRAFLLEMPFYLVIFHLNNLLPAITGDSANIAAQ